MAEKEKVETGLQILAKTKYRYQLTLSKFQKFHDLIKEAPELYTKETIFYVDTVAVSFRDMGKESSLTAKLVSKEYLNTAIIFYKKIESFETEEIREMLKLIGGQAKQFKNVFKAISVWANWVSTQFHEIHDDILAKEVMYKIRYAEVVRKAKNAMDSASDVVRKAKADMKASKDSAERWREIALAAPSRDIATAIKAEMENCIAVKVEEKKDEQAYNEAKQKLKAARSKEEKAKVLADRVVELSETLKRMETISHGISAIWELTSERFDIWGEDILSSELFAGIKVVLESVALENIRGMTQDLKDMDAYAEEMASIMTSHNYKTAAESPQGRIYYGSTQFERTPFIS